MANVIFTTKVNPVYDDLPEFRYHFPSTYLNQAKQAVGDWILYYEPRREGADLAGRAGRQCYFAAARVTKIEEDKSNSGHYYAYVTDYLQFPKPVPFRIGKTYFESGLRKEDGSTNKGRFGRSIRIISLEDFQIICRLGFQDAQISPQDYQTFQRLEDQPVELAGERRMLVTQRPFRDAAFTRLIQDEYDNTCAMTGLRLVNAGGLCEIEAAHIRPVNEQGPDSGRNGIALARTIHWLFDRHFLSISDAGEILVAKKHVPEKVCALLNPDMKIKTPLSSLCQPHPSFLRHHRERFKGN
ncbi:MAG TPA: HNH endonuclease [Verrucomicrobiae bacterium]|nr:HNH endonuclease [Verrucomicrobiae bacterium]